MNKDGKSLAVRLLEAKHGEGYRPTRNSRVGGLLFNEGPRETPELRRILALPWKDEESVDLTNEFLLKKKCWPGCMLCRPKGPNATCTPGCARCQDGEAHLWPIQSDALRWARFADGLLAPVGTGHGKTLITLLLPLAMNSKRAVLLVPPQLRDQLRSMIATYSRHWRLPTIAFGSDGGGGAILRVLGYSELSLAKNTDVLERIDPDLVICDECHNVRHRQAARTRRFLRFFKNKPECRSCNLSGSMTMRSVHDYAHLSELTLRKNSPLPKPYPELCDWSCVLDAKIEMGRRMSPGALSKLGPGDVREAFRKRLVGTPGVVATGEGSLGTSLLIRLSHPKVPGGLCDVLDDLERTWRIGDDEIEEASRMAAVARQLSYGFHYRWDWPNGVVDEEWLAARSAWHREMRGKLSHNPQQGLDSPLLLANAAASGRWASLTWGAWARVKDRPAPPTVPVWIDSEFAPALASKWMNEGGPGVIWYEHEAVGALVATVLGLPRFAGGSDAALQRATPEKMPTIVCSINAHGTGKELQAWSRALILGAPANGTRWEQVLGRLHRPGQESEEVEYVLPAHTKWIERAFDQALADARYEEATIGGRQKLLYAEVLR